MIMTTEHKKILIEHYEQLFLNEKRELINWDDDLHKPKDFSLIFVEYLEKKIGLDLGLLYCDDLREKDRLILVFAIDIGVYVLRLSKPMYKGMYSSYGNWITDWNDTENSLIKEYRKFNFK